MKSEDLLAGLNSAQVQAVTTVGGPVAVMAGAGSGKTRVLTRRIAWRIANDDAGPNHVLALTFTRKAASELRHRLVALGLRDHVGAGTFHAMALLQLRQRWAERGVVAPALLDRKSRLIGSLLPRSPRVNVGDVAAEIDWARARLVGPDYYGTAAREAGRTPPLPPEDLAEVMIRFQQEKQKRRVVDFDDLLMLAIRDLRTDTGYAEAIRWRYRHLFVDEFQDVNPLQYELLSLWRGGRNDLFVVGDPNQAIYGWNGADPNLLSRFVRREPDTTVIDLQDNYRSTPQVLSLASALVTSRPLRAHRPDGPNPTITAYPSDLAEAAGVAQRIREARTVAGDWGDQAVLVRTNAQLLVLEQGLRDAAIPTRLRGGSGPLATPEVRAELQRLGQLEVNLEAAVALLDERLSEERENLSVAEIERRANVAAFVRLVHDYLALDPRPTGQGLTAWIKTLESGDFDDKAEAVDLATFHSSKGLEWPVVHVAGLEEGFVPIAYASTGAQLSEEKRLLYVALTRAQDELHLSWAAERTFTNKPVKRQASPYLGALDAAKGRLNVGPEQRVDWRSHIKESRAQLARSAPVPVRATAGDGAYEALKQWRQRQARAADVPPHVVLSDQTLRAIARDLPRTKARLASMPGMRPAKLQRYGDDVLDVLGRSGEARPGPGRG